MGRRITIGIVTFLVTVSLYTLILGITGVLALSGWVLWVVLTMGTIALMGVAVGIVLLLLGFVLYICDNWEDV